jgi:hypothetical protein
MSNFIQSNEYDMDMYVKIQYYNMLRSLYFILSRFDFMEFYLVQ